MSNANNTLMTESNPPEVKIMQKDSGISSKSIEVQNIEKFYADLQVLKGVSFTLEEGEFLTLLGPSGSGKSTTLGIISGFIDLDKGDVKIDGRSLIGTPTKDRNLGIVFQNYALFPHLTVSENIEFGLRMRKVDRASRKKQSAQMLSKVGLDGLGDRKPKQLSGGQQQRVALARALIINPTALLLDEPLGALDRRLRQQVELEIKGIQKDTGVSVLHVTHDQEEAMVMSDRLAVMNQGLIEQIDSPTNVYKYPSTRFVAEFLGEVNLFDVKIQDFVSEKASVTYQNGSIGSAHVSSALAVNVIPGKDASVCVRPERVQVLGSNDSAENEFTVIVKDSIYLGATTRMLVTAMGLNIIVTSSDNENYSVPDAGREVRIGWNSDDAQLLFD
ncbi:MAG: putative spermidine/putrescine transport system ATP-binding protein [Gammaproteobacteria bacterium]|jgi:putative spermidine/putrescine transport system ATP-binding protein